MHRSRAVPAPSSTATATSAAAPVPWRRRRPRPPPRCPPRRPPGRPSPPAPPPRRSPTAQPCTQPGCPGNIVDGYCDVCGSPAAAPAPGSAADLDRGPVDSGQVAGVGSTITRGSSRLGSTALGSSRAVASGSKITRRVHAGSQRLRSARLGAGLTRVPPAPEIDASQGDHEEPGGPRGQAHLPELRRTRSAGPATGSRAAPRASAPSAATPFSFTPKLQAGRPRGEPVRGGRLPRPRRARLDLPGPGPERVRPLGRAQGPAQLRRPGRAGRGDRRAAVPGPGRAPADRRDLQLRHPRRRRLHRDGVRRRHLAEADPEGADAGQRRPLRPAAGRPGPRLHPRDPAGVPVPARPRPGLLRLQAGQPHPGRRRGQADRPRRRAADRRRRTRRSTAPSATRRPRSPRSAPPSPPTSTRSAARWWC